MTSGHFVAEENPSATLEALQEFLKRPGAQRRSSKNSRSKAAASLSRMPP